VGPDAARLTFLLQSIDTKQLFDIDLVRSQAMDNPVYYVQYAHARISSIGRVAAERGVERRPLGDVDMSLLTHERELDVLRSLAELPDVVGLASAERAPHKVTTWVRELAGRFHGFYHDCYVIGDVPPELTQARLWLVEAARVGLAIGLDLLGVSAPESM
jgi:arginyl-tRNA synthetase